MKSCLVLIDIQESFRHRPYFSETELPAYLAAQNALIAACQREGVPIVRVFHVPLRAADIKARTAAVLKDRFAAICSVPQAVERLAVAA